MSQPTATEPATASSSSASVKRASRPRLPRMQEAGLLVVILLLGLILTFAAEPISVRGHMINNFFRIDNIIPNVATPMSWMAIMALGVTFVIVSGGIDISVGSIFGLAALSTAAGLQNFPENASPWVVLPLAVGVPLAIGLLCGLINGALVVSLRMHPFIVTLGTLSIFRGIALISVPSKSLPYGDKSLPDAFISHFMSWQINIPRASAPPLMLQPVPMVVMVLCVIAGWIFLSH